MTMRTGNGRWRRWGVALLVLAVGAMACRSEPTPRTRGRGGERGAVGGMGESELATSGVPTACTDTFRKGGLPIGNAPRKGSSDPLVAIVEFANLECADCAKAAGKVDEILQRFGDDVALYYVQVEGSPPAVQPGQPAPPRLWRLAAQASLAAAANDKFWPFVERAYASGGKLNQPDLEQYAQQVGIDINAFRSQMNARDVQDQVDAGQSLALDVGVRGPLPMFWVDGTLVQANEVDSRLAQLVEQEVGKARDALLAPRSRCEMLARQVVTRQMSGRGAAGAQPTQRPQRPQEDPNALYKIPVGASPVKGPADALVTLMLFTDFQCPHCARVAATLDELAKAYPNDLRLVYKNNPLPGHDKAQLAAEAAMAAGAQGKFWEFHDAMFAAMRTYYDSPNRDPAAPHPLDRPNLEKIAETLRLNMGGFKKALDEHTTTGAIQADLELARRFAISGTPTFAMNGKKFSGNLPLEEFKRRVEAAIAEAKKLVDSGVPRAQVYDKLTAAGSDRAVFLPMPAGEMAPQAMQQPSRPTGPQPLPAEAKDVKVESWNPTRGPANAKVTMVVFCEYLCPFCKKIQDTLRILQTAYGDQLRVAFRQHIVHPPAEPLSLAALAAQRQGKFEELHALFFANQGDLQQKCYQDANACRQAIDTYAGQIAGLDLNRLHTDMDSAQVRQQ